MGRLIRVLSIDGGGIRGLIPAILLAELERLTGRPVAETFDLIAGTSTGGILALGLTCPGADGKPRYRASDLVDLYVAEGPVIFRRSGWRRVGTVGGLFEEKYPSDGIESVLEKYFGERRIDEALTDVLVTAYALEQRRPYFFKSRSARSGDAPAHRMREAARATSAAPTFFEPARLAMHGPAEYDALVDGGVFANPAMCAWAEAQKHLVERADDEILVVSLGTGELVRPIPWEQAKDWGLANWAVPILDVVFDGVSDVVDYQLRQLLQPVDGERRYYRFQTRLDEGFDDMDDASRTNLRVLRLLATDLIQRSEIELATLAKRLAESGSGR